MINNSIVCFEPYNIMFILESLRVWIPHEHMVYIHIIERSSYLGFTFGIRAIEAFQGSVLISRFKWAARVHRAEQPEQPVSAVFLLFVRLIGWSASSFAVGLFVNSLF